MTATAHVLLLNISMQDNELFMCLLSDSMSQNSSSHQAIAADRMVRNDQPGSPPDMLYVYLYNITNLEEVHQGAKPHLDEVGPYVYRKRRIKLVSPHHFPCLLPSAHVSLTQRPLSGSWYTREWGLL